MKINQTIHGGQKFDSNDVILTKSLLEITFFQNSEDIC
jgi:hypothetical protein